MRLPLYKGGKGDFSFPFPADSHGETPLIYSKISVKLYLNGDN
jgi:hypothetical protein